MALIITNKNGQETDCTTIPDCWHAAMWIKENGNPAMGSGVTLSEMILDCWHMAHAMKDHIEQGGE